MSQRSRDRRGSGRSAKDLRRGGSSRSSPPGGRGGAPVAKGSAGGGGSGPGRPGGPGRRGGGRPGTGRGSGGGRRPLDPRLIAALAAAAILVVIAVILGGVFGGSPARSPSSSGIANGCPTSQPAPLPAGQTRTVTIQTLKGNIVIKVEGSLSPIAAGNFVALASCGYYDDVVFHRTATLQDGTPFVIQGGDGQYGRVGSPTSYDPAKVGQGTPGYTIQDEQVTTTYQRGTVAMARGQQANSQGSQFFIVLDDKDQSTLAGGGYAIFGNVTSGMAVADAIYQASAGVELPANPIPMTKVTVSNP